MESNESEQATEVVFEEPVAGTCRFELVISHNLERKLEAAVKLVLPLLG